MPNKYTQPPRENKNAADSANPPVKTFRLGRVKAAVALASHERPVIPAALSLVATVFDRLLDSFSRGLKSRPRF